MTEKFTLFYNGIYSNWYLVDFVDINGTKFNCTEQYMMYCKAMTFGDTETADLIMKERGPKEQKALGRTVKNFDAQAWDQICKNVVYTGCFYKFEQNPELKKEFLATDGTTLVECSKKDKIWGIGFYADAPECLDRSKWLGTNYLGETLTELRDDFINNTIHLWVLKKNCE